MNTFSFFREDSRTCRTHSRGLAFSSVSYIPDLLISSFWRCLMCLVFHLSCINGSCEKATWPDSVLGFAGFFSWLIVHLNLFWVIILFAISLIPCFCFAVAFAFIFVCMGCKNQHPYKVFVFPNSRGQAAQNLSDF